MSTLTPHKHAALILEWANQMTQTITNCNAIPAGKTYPVKHLRTAESIEQLCAYVDAGHPIANDVGSAVCCFQRRCDEHFMYRVEWADTLIDTECLCSDVLNTIKLAPLAYRNGRPLHVGDEIVVRIFGLRWDTMKMPLDYISCVETMHWLFADEAVNDPSKVN